MPVLARALSLVALVVTLGCPPTTQDDRRACNDNRNCDNATEVCQGGFCVTADRTGDGDIGHPSDGGDEPPRDAGGVLDAGGDGGFVGDGGDLDGGELGDGDGDGDVGDGDGDVGDGDGDVDPPGLSCARPLGDADGFQVCGDVVRAEPRAFVGGNYQILDGTVPARGRTPLTGATYEVK